MAPMGANKLVPLASAAGALRVPGRINWTRVRKRLRKTLVERFEHPTHVVVAHDPDRTRWREVGGSRRPLRTGNSCMHLARVTQLSICHSALHAGKSHKVHGAT